MKRFLCGLFCILLANSCSADFVIVGYDTTNPNGANGDPSPDLPAADFPDFVTPLNLSRNLIDVTGNAGDPGLVPNQGIAFNSRDWSTSSTLNLNSGDFIQWGWSASSNQLDLTDMTIQYDRSGSGPERLAIMLSVDGGNQFTQIFSDNFVDPSDETHTIDLNAFDAVTSATFRLYGYAADSSGGTLDIEEIVEGGRRGILVRGELSTVPEPASSLAFGVVVLGLVVRRGRR
ncbi:MAG: PEP-CTERM sorting domain-containing protein [Aureliella sp.]